LRHGRAACRPGGIRTIRAAAPPTLTRMQSRRFFLYTRSNDLVASRHFYTDLVGLEQIWDETGSIAYGIADAVQFSIDFDPAAIAETGWAFQPGWVFGLGIQPQPPLARASWSIPLTPEHFRAAVSRLQRAEVEALRPGPFWV